MATAVQGLTVSWSAAAGAAGYKVQWKSGSKSYSSAREAAVSDSGASHTILGLIAGRTYTIRVFTVPTGGGADLPSTERTASPTAPSYAASTTVRAHTSASGTGNRYPAETLQPATNPDSAISWKTTEYNANGLDRINAAEGYAACAGITGCRQGGGGTIAIFERGIDVETDSHPAIRTCRERPFSERVRAAPPARRLPASPPRAATRRACMASPSTRTSWDCGTIKIPTTIFAAPFWHRSRDGPKRCTAPSPTIEPPRPAPTSST